MDKVKLEELMTDFENTCFECAEYDDDPKLYEELLLEFELARKRLRDFILENGD